MEYLYVNECTWRNSSIGAIFLQAIGTKSCRYHPQARDWSNKTEFGSSRLLNQLSDIVETSYFQYTITQTLPFSAGQTTVPQGVQSGQLSLCKKSSSVKSHAGSHGNCLAIKTILSPTPWLSTRPCHSQQHHISYAFPFNGILAPKRIKTWTSLLINQWQSQACL